MCCLDRWCYLPNTPLYAWPRGIRANRVSNTCGVESSGGEEADGEGAGGKGGEVCEFGGGGQVRGGLLIVEPPRSQTPPTSRGHVSGRGEGTGGVGDGEAEGVRQEGKGRGGTEGAGGSGRGREGWLGPRLTFMPVLHTHTHTHTHTHLCMYVCMYVCMYRYLKKLFCQ